MAKVVGIHLFDLKPGTDPKEFERFVVDEVHPAMNRADINLTVSKGERGERLGNYLLMFEFDSVASRDRYFPGKGGPSEEAKALVGLWWDKFGTFAEITGVFTDYVALGG